MMPVKQECSICKKLFWGSDAMELPIICFECKLRANQEALPVEITKLIDEQFFELGE